MKRPLILLFILLIATIALPQLFNRTGTSGAHNILSLDGHTMGTTYHIAIAANPKAEITPEQLAERIDTRLQHINQMMSTYIDTSEISRINQAPAETDVAISSETMEVIAAALQISRETSGAFDITIGKLVNLWGFGPDVNLYAIPDAENITSMLNQTGYDQIELQSEPPSVRKKTSAVYLDLSGIAKGYAVDEVSALLSTQGYANHLVEIGGEIRTSGDKGNGQAWSIGIERPIKGERSVQKIIHTSSSIAMATSGDYRNYFEHKGKRYSHTIDPATGYPISHKLAAVSVIEPSCMLADGYATALMVMGPEHAMSFARKHDLAIYMLVKNEHGFMPISSPAFEKMISSTAGK